MAGKTVNLTIKGYKDEKCSGGAKTIVVPINPESISRSHPLSFSASGGDDTESKDQTAKYASLGYDQPGTPSIGMQTLKFDIYFDSTGLIYNSTPVSESIDKFKGVCYVYKGVAHGLNYLKLEWGELFKKDHKTLKFRLSSLDIEYQLFSPNGEPIRAKVSCGFTQFMSIADINAFKNNSSPDLTHMKAVRAGDTLPLMSNDVYRDPKYYFQVAQVNGLASIHELERGQRIIFPPFEQ